MKLIWCSGFPEIYAQLEKGVGSVCHVHSMTLVYMCILLYVYNCFGVDILSIRRMGSICHGYIVYSAIYETYLA